MSAARHAARHVVLAPDSFKGSLTAAEVAAHLAAGLGRAAPDVPVRHVPVADGGEGTVDAACAAGFTALTAVVAGPTGEPVRCRFAVHKATAVVELAAASGPAALPGGRPAPLAATSLGTGQLVRAALDSGCTEVVLGLGGSACTDGGAGLLVGLGARLHGAAGQEFVPGRDPLETVERADLAGLDPRLRGARIVLAADVDNPLLGPSGAAAVYGPQKGATGAEVSRLEAGLTRWRAVLGAVQGPDAWTAAGLPGAGAAGGVGFACLAVLGAARRPGIEVVLDLVGFDTALAGARLVITGEGSLDGQTLRGKAPAGVAWRARAAGVAAVAAAGRCLLSPAQLRTAGLSAAYPLTDLDPDVRRCIDAAGPLVERTAERIARDWLRAIARG